MRPLASRATRGGLRQVATCRVADGAEGGKRKAVPGSNAGDGGAFQVDHSGAAGRIGRAFAGFRSENGAAAQKHMARAAAKRLGERGVDGPALGTQDDPVRNDDGARNQRRVEPAREAETDEPSHAGRQRLGGALGARGVAPANPDRMPPAPSQPSLGLQPDDDAEAQAASAAITRCTAGRSPTRRR